MYEKKPLLTKVTGHASANYRKYRKLNEKTKHRNVSIVLEMGGLTTEAIENGDRESIYVTGYRVHELTS